jgi:hypothetical protein
MRGRNKEFIVAGIKNLLKTDYKLSPDLYDIESEVDSKLTFCENWYHFKKKYHVSIYSMGLK